MTEPGWSSWSRGRGASASSDRGAWTPADASRRFDLAVIGGGPAGAATAIRAAQLGLTVAVIDAARATDLRIGETVPADLELPLRRLGAWDAFLADGHLPASERRWQRAEFWRRRTGPALGPAADQPRP